MKLFFCFCLSLWFAIVTVLIVSGKDGIWLQKSVLFQVPSEPDKF